MFYLMFWLRCFICMLWKHEIEKYLSNSVISKLLFLLGLNFADELLVLNG